MVMYSRKKGKTIKTRITQKRIRKGKNRKNRVAVRTAFPIFNKLNYSVKKLKNKKIDLNFSNHMEVSSPQFPQSILTQPASSMMSSSSSPSIPSPPFNEAFSKVLGRLHSMMISQGEPFRARAYKNAQETIQGITFDITSVEQLKSITGIGSTILSKLDEYVRTGTLSLFEKEKENPIYVLTQVFGIGPKKAEELVKVHHIRSIDELRKHQGELLNDKQRIGLLYYEDILKRIPRSEIDKYKDELTSAFKTAVPSKTAHFEIVGSYRRGAVESGDIDVVISDLSGNSSVMTRFIDELRKRGIVIETLSEGKSKSLAISRIAEHPARRIDFLYASPDEYAFAVLYFTGSASFNVVMRQYAISKGFTLNEHGLYVLDSSGVKGTKISTPLLSEEAIFEFLGLKFKSPSERVDGRAVQPLSSSSSTVSTEILPVSHSQNGGTKPAASGAGGDDDDDEKPIKKMIKVKKIKPIISDKDTMEKEDSVRTAIPSPTIPTIPLKKTLKIKKKIKAKVAEVSDVKTDIQKFKTSGIDFLASLSLSDIANMLLTANEAYYNKTPLITDSQYDIIREYLEHKDPTHPALRKVGASVSKDKVKLPYYMGSMDKIKPDTRALQDWKTRYSGPYVVSAKLDGISALYVVDEDGTAQLFTRGDGIIGQNITHVIPYLNLPRIKGIAVRGELIMTKKMFETIYADEGAPNSRNLVAGILNRKTRTPEDYRNINFVAYEVIEPTGLSPSAQLKFLETHSEDKIPWIRVEYDIIRSKDDLTNELLSKQLIEMRNGYDYEIDGLIVANDAVYPRREGNPEHAFAFKMLLTDQVVEAKVLDVIWTASKDGYLKPRIRIEPVFVSGVVIEYATAFNAAFIEENNIGIGAVVRLIRSGDVIPHILSVEVPAPSPKMPEVAYQWNDTHVDIMLENKDDATVRLKVITSFLKTLGVDGAGEGNVRKMTKAGYDTIPKVLAMSVSDYMKVDGFGERLAMKIHDGIQKAVKEVDLPTLMDATNIFGRGMGQRRLREIMDVLPDILENNATPTAKIARISSIHGFAKKTAEKFVSNIQDFLDFLEETGLEWKLDKKNKGAVVAAAAAAASSSHKHQLYGKSIVMTGFRDKELIAAIEAVGGKTTDSVSKNTSYVIVKDLSETSVKAAKARELGIPIILLNEFKKLL